MFNNFATLFLVLSAALCGTLAYEFRRLHSDEAAGRNEFPYMAAMLVKNRYHCNAVIIKPLYILATAACILHQKDHIKDIRIRTGTDSIYAGGELHEVESYIIHNVTKDDRDAIGALKLKKSIQFNDRQKSIPVGPVPKELIDSDPWKIALPFAGNWYGTLSGWGKNRAGTDKHFSLRKVDETIIERFPRCKKFLNDAGLKYYDHTLCSYVRYAFLGSDGSVLVYNNTLAGLATYADFEVITNANRPAYASAFAYIYKLQDFVNSLV
ncbi:trypsin epsilon-like [Prorops nasuta]|uniref:trypsin epsilon-like n=1 Tax=Prorops nasuta TaxID=863751 RepID=UPI0034CFDFA5